MPQAMHFVSNLAFLRALISSSFLLLYFHSSQCAYLSRNCTRPLDCDVGWTCAMATCVPAECHLSSECPVGWECTSGMQCLRTCLADDDCKFVGWRCSVGRVCLQGDCHQCRAGEKCVEGQCFPSWMKGLPEDK